ncbi:MAG: hypothetical protein K0Q96_1278 [Rubrobacteraceae bacterium]|jgi:hypothetical protein|nr:hypothetical protein [Rubrobacteraceae bacterium]
MTSPRITYTPHPDATPEAELCALAAIYTLVLSNSQAKRGGTHDLTRWTSEGFVLVVRMASVSSKSASARRPKHPWTRERKAESPTAGSRSLGPSSPPWPSEIKTTLWPRYFWAI